MSKFARELPKKQMVSQMVQFAHTRLDPSCREKQGGMEITAQWKDTWTKLIHHKQTVWPHENLNWNTNMGVAHQLAYYIRRHTQ